jgi:hypothetical protein
VNATWSEKVESYTTTKIAFVRSKKQSTRNRNGDGPAFGVQFTIRK